MGHCVPSVLKVPLMVQLDWLTSVGKGLSQVTGIGF
jgi:hypothetical protein